MRKLALVCLLVSRAGAQEEIVIEGVDPFPGDWFLRGAAFRRVRSTAEKTVATLGDELRIAALSAREPGTLGCAPCVADPQAAARLVGLPAVYPLRTQYLRGHVEGRFPNISPTQGDAYPRIHAGESGRRVLGRVTGAVDLIALSRFVDAYVLGDYLTYGFNTGMVVKGRTLEETPAGPRAVLTGITTSSDCEGVGGARNVVEYEFAVHRGDLVCTIRHGPFVPFEHPRRRD